MTPTRYLIVRAAQAFGYFRRNQRMSDAASEMHLLREAEAYLGSTIWENVENIEALSVEYWNLRKLVKERNHVRQRLAACQEKLALAHEERVSVLKSTPEFDQQLLDHRQDLLNELEHLSKQRDDIVAQAREVRRTFVGLKMKLEVLAKESTDSSSTKEETDKVKARLLELKNQFEQLKHERITVGEKIELGDNQIAEIDEQIRQKRQHRRGQASEAFQLIGEGNKEISTLRAESALIDTKMHQLYAEIGRYVSRHAKQDPTCAAASHKYHSLVDVMRALRRSIALNHRLAGTA